MRKTSAVDRLINKTTQALLGATVLQPDRSWYLSDLAKHLRRRPSSLQQPLAALVSAGILTRRKEGNRVYFRTDPDCPFLPELQGLIAKTVGLVDVIRDSLSPLADQLEVAFIHGSVAKAREQAASDIDLIVIGSLGLAELSPVLEGAESRLGRPVNANVYSPAEFAKKLAAGNHFLRSVLGKKKLFVIGKPHDLKRIHGGKTR
jgi:DNA-binding transcriptional ArsR family regulator